MGFEPKKGKFSSSEELSSSSNAGVLGAEGLLMKVEDLTGAATGEGQENRVDIMGSKVNLH